MSFPWYTIIEDSVNDLQQGDFIPDCPILVPPAEMNFEGENDIEITFIDSIILSQSCDLVHGKLEIVLVCPYRSLSSFLEGLPEEQQGSKARKKVIENLRKGNLPGYHLLNKDDQLAFLSDYQVVDFRNVYGVHFKSLQSFVEKISGRIRLQPPYREHMSQAFARYFMRVGLPQDIIVEGY
ncbi:hypothetical protein ACT6NV_06375 [Robiginitalea sp. IMCC44478]|uniref:hypothetical protein n=1 Tax=Robiginitalea sp. IMCC44478 TaxID=3459122 RepID=UPI004040EEA7